MNKQFTLVGVTLIGLLGCQLGYADNELTKVMDKTEVNQQSGRNSQFKIDELYEEKRAALQEMRITQAEIDQLTVYNRQLREIIANQNNQIVSLNKQINDIESTQQGIMPLMERMLNGLEQFISLDIPFLLSEREQRIASLRALLLTSDVTVSEKFRRVLEAFQIEIEYGRTIEAYRAENNDGKTVDFLRIGRTALMNVTLNGDHAQAWDNNKREWAELDDDYTRAIAQGVSIARKQAAPSLLGLPMQSMQEAK